MWLGTEGRDTWLSSTNIELGLQTPVHVLAYDRYGAKRIFNLLQRKLK